MYVHIQEHTYVPCVVQSPAEGCWHPRLVEGGPSVGPSESPSTPRAENSHPQKIGQLGNGRMEEWENKEWGKGGKGMRRKIEGWKGGEKKLKLVRKCKKYLCRTLCS